MSNEADSEELNVNIVWLEKSIADEYLNYYEYSDFRDIKLIGQGNFGKVFSANWKNTDTTFALKSFDDYNLTLKEVVNEVQIY